MFVILDRDMLETAVDSLCLHLSPLNTQTSKNQIKVDLVDENFTELMGEIAGPPDTPYEGNTSSHLRCDRLTLPQDFVTL